MEDCEIVKLLGEDSHKGILELEDKYQNLIKYIIRGILYEYNEDSEECYWDVLLRCVEKIADYDEKKSAFRTWLTTITKRIALDKRKQIERMQNHVVGTIEESYTDMEDKRQNVERQIVKEEEYRHMVFAIKQLPKKERDMFLRKYYYMQSAEQIAVEMGKSKRSVESSLLRIRRKLKEEIMAYRQKGGSKFE